MTEPIRICTDESCSPGETSLPGSITALGTTTLTIVIVSDVICPWCFIGKRRLEKALKLLGDPRDSEHVVRSGDPLRTPPPPRSPRPRDDPSQPRP